MNARAVWLACWLLAGGIVRAQCIATLTPESAVQRRLIIGQVVKSPGGSWLIAVEEGAGCAPATVWVGAEWELQAYVGQRVRLAGMLDVSPSPYWPTLYNLMPETLELRTGASWQSRPLAKRPAPAKLPPPRVGSYSVRGVVLLRPHLGEQLRVTEARELPNGPPLDARQFQLASFWLNGGRDLLQISCAEGFAVTRLTALTPNGTRQRVEEDPGIGYRYVIEGQERSEFDLECTSTSPRIDPDILAVITRWVTTLRNRDLAGHMSTFGQHVDQYYLTRNLTRTAVATDVSSSLALYSSPPRDHARKLCGAYTPTGHGHGGI